MTIALATPDTTGFRADFSATTVKIRGNEFVGYKSVSGGRTRSRGIVMGANADPLGKTRGTNAYKLSLEVYVAEFKAFVLDTLGEGYGDIQFPVEVDVTEQGYDTQNYRFVGCTVDETSIDFSQGNDALTVKIAEFNPTKMTINGIDDNAKPLGGAPAIG